MPDITTLPTPPEGAQWEFSEVKTNHGKDTLGDRPVLVWDATEAGIAGARAKYGDEGVANALNGTSLMVSFQSIARRLAIAGASATPPKADEVVNAEIAEAILKFVPGKRSGETSAAGAAGRAAKQLAETVGDKGAEAVAALLKRIRERVQSGEMTAEEVEALEL